MGSHGACLRRAVAGVAFAAAMLPGVAAANEIVIGETEKCRGSRVGWSIDSSDPKGTQVWADPGEFCRH